MGKEEGSMDSREPGIMARLLDLLALEGYPTRLKNLTVPYDAISWRRFTGSLCLVLLMLLFVTGPFMSLYYSPVPAAAYDSVDFAQYEIPFGGVIRGIHHYAWTGLLIVMGLHLATSFILGAYKAPRQMVWISGVILLLVIPASIITGDLLPWTQEAYWTTQVRASIISSVPVAGDLAVSLLLGGPRTGIVALTRFYVLHIIFMPGILILLTAVHFHFLSQCGLAGPIKETPTQRPPMPLVPNAASRWLLLFLATAVILGLLARYYPVYFGDPADPTDSNFVPRPEWWVLFLNQLVGIFRGPWSVLGTVAIPGGLAAFLLALPFIDRGPERRPARRKSIILAGLVIAAILIALSVAGYYEHHVIPNR
jgi:ubiquinol-cytochrome c reductase cytochrome b subunit